MKYRVWLTMDRNGDYRLWHREKPSYRPYGHWSYYMSDDLGSIFLCTSDTMKLFPLKRHMKGGPKSIKCFEVTVEEVKE